VKDRITDVRKTKSKILTELDQKIKVGNDLVNNLTEDKEIINNFLTDFTGFLAETRTKTSYEGEVEKLIVDENEETLKKEVVVVKVNKEVIKQVLNQKESEINILISHLKEYLELEQVTEKLKEEIRDFSDNNESISEEQKRAIIEYLDDLIFQAKDYSLAINETNSKEKTENIRAKIVDEVIFYCEHVKEYKREIGNENDRPIYEAVKGSSKKVKEILTDFAALLKQETELELGKSFTTLLPEQQNLLKISGE
ncbi:27357_t:CDS:2, partial [Racocetra persica]